MSSGVSSVWVNFHPQGDTFTRVTLEFSREVEGVPSWRIGVRSGCLEVLEVIWAFEPLLYPQVLIQNP